MNTAVEHADLLLIGAGPSNIALAVALEELGCPPGVGKVLMLEAGEAISWHPGLLFPQAQSQVSFLKDLATLRDPTSRYTFLNFLHQTGRLDDFVNLQTFFPYRREIAAYLRWCVDQLRTVQLRYRARVESIAPVVDEQGRVQHWRVACQDGRCVIAQRVVYGAGRAAHVPEPFSALGSAQLVHASRFMQHVAGLDASRVQRVAVIGGAQSSAEVYEECLRRFPQAQVQLFTRSIGLLPYGGSKFTNELYTDDFIDHFHAAAPDDRQRWLAAMHDSNYSGVTPATLESLFRLHYLQRMEHGERAQIHTHSRVLQAQDAGEQVRLRWTAGPAQTPGEACFDLVVLGTGYCNELPPLLRRVAQALTGGEQLPVDRHYRAGLRCAPGASLHVLGVNEATHGISDTLLSVVGARARRIVEDLRADTRSAALLHDLPASNTSPLIAAEALG